MILQKHVILRENMRKHEPNQGSTSGASENNFIQK
jgi:hypothetical protein